jgi:hypothetical protein
VPQPHEVLDFMLNARKVDIQKAWNGKVDVAELVPYNTFEDAIRLARDVLENGTYYDTHCWVFTPRSFSELCERLASVGLLHFACETLHDTEQNQLEFFVKLRLCDDREKIIKSWRWMKESVREDMTDSVQAGMQTEREALLRKLAGSREKINLLALQLDEASISLGHRSDSLEVAQRRIESLENSLSWKLTTPLRFVDRTLRQLTTFLVDCTRGA